MQWGRDPQNPVSNVSDEPMMINDAILDGWSSMGRNLQVQPFHPCLYQRRQDWCEGPSGTTFTGGWLGDSRSTWPCQTPEFIQMRSILTGSTYMMLFFFSCVVAETTCCFNKHADAGCLNYHQLHLIQGAGALGSRYPGDANEADSPREARGGICWVVIFLFEIFPRKFIVITKTWLKSTAIASIHIDITLHIWYIYIHAYIYIYIFYIKAFLSCYI